LAAQWGLSNKKSTLSERFGLRAADLTDMFHRLLAGRLLVGGAPHSISTSKNPVKTVRILLQAI